MITKPTKYTEEFVLKEVKQMIKEVKENKHFLVGQLFENRDYGQQRYREWKHKFKEHEEITALLIQLSNLIQSNLISRGLFKELDSSLTKFVMINHYNYADKKEIEQRSESNVNIRNYSDLSGDEINDLLNKKLK